MSRIAMNMPRHIKMKPNQVATLAWVVLQIGGALAADADFSICGNGKLRDGNGPRCNTRAGTRCTPSPCPGRSAACSSCGTVRCRAGVVTNSGVWYGPGSAERHEECRTASG